MPLRGPPVAPQQGTSSRKSRSSPASTLRVVAQLEAAGPGIILSMMTWPTQGKKVVGPRLYGANPHYLSSESRAAITMLTLKLLRELV